MKFFASGNRGKFWEDEKTCEVFSKDAHLFVLIRI